MKCDHTERQLARLRELVKEAGEIGCHLRKYGPVEIRFEASQLVAGIGDVDELLRDLTLALAMAEQEAA